ncbi:inosine-uridine preferring nucleoside hydrolase-like [Mercenaria mercenaria]|uniref:inosine-uridine preferring nucleoside hydrolase-like n=1 Tax=Mercenaria mercenaria TaxID=6596 RepID=UPI00234ECE62|nr:inosine-uridine preferring nucleoside hydrolase-like [Mercenaria mercenaria]XP_053381427.1 inosine-uridine preferring nucleoside hydrolase-like [Mercenaria mercenaria]XP_053381428.1 inosine-uridine preferring nucleoside hydrolase-like [Mercenaria mercenaria]
MPKKIVIDCDPGNDDAMSIFMALSDPDIDLKAITCVEGNTRVKQTALNALRTLQATDRLDIPVYVGCNAPLLGEVKGRSPYHGSDGFGDVPDPNAPDESQLQAEHGVMALLRLSKAYKGDLHLVAIGPLTNVAMAIRLDPEFGTRLKSCSIMGGNYLGKGNISVGGEFNFYFDPEAAYVVLNQLKCPITIMPWETCMQHTISFETHTQMRNAQSKKADLMKKIDQTSVEFDKKRGTTAFIPADEAIMACVLRSDVIKNSVHEYATVETKGQYTYGQMVVDWRGKLQKGHNVTIVTELDQTLYEHLMATGLA